MKNVFALLIIAISIVVSPMYNVQAYENSIVYLSESVLHMDRANEPKADVIVVKFRTHNGVPQYRRWNETQGCWVDPDWIDVN